PDRDEHVGRTGGKVSGMSSYGRWCPATRLALALLLWIVLATTQGRAWGEEAGRITILEENYSLYFNSDKHYTGAAHLGSSRRSPCVGRSEGRRLSGPRQRLSSL